MSLTEYVKKRNFKKTVEPKGTLGKDRKNRFVIQKHAASHLHYDFRLEMDGVLKSWAVPKGVPYARGEKRLAMEVEDHPVSYIDFEGTIPKGQYGGGTVMVWDRGHFISQSPNPAEELKKGKLHFTLHGEKLEGEWYLVRMRDSRQWLLIKGGEGMKPVSKNWMMRQLSPAKACCSFQRTARSGDLNHATQNRQLFGSRPHPRKKRRKFPPGKHRGGCLLNQ